MAKYIIAHDVGTSGNKAVLVDTEGRVIHRCGAFNVCHCRCQSPRS